MNDFTHTFSLLFQFYYHHHYYYYQTRYFPSKIPWQRIKSHTKNPLHSTSNYPPQFRWPVNESFISNFRGGKLSCAVKFPARSTLRSKAPAEKPVIMKSFDVDLSDGIVRREVYACKERKKWLNYSALACATFQIGTMFRRIPHVITGQRILSREIFVSGIDKEFRSWHFNGVYSVFSTCSREKREAIEDYLFIEPV